MRLPVRTLGYLVPRGDFAGRVHSAFTRACNIEAGGGLLAIVEPDGDDAPAALRLAPGAPPDLSRLFERGEPIVVRRAGASTPRVTLCFAGAATWRPPPPRPLLPGSEIRARVDAGFARLSAHPRAAAGVLAREAAPVAAAFAAACRDRDGEGLARSVDRLVGWGEGLTPAGDDFLVGALAALDALASRRHGRGAPRAALAQAIAARLERTTPLSAQQLRLAIGGHYAATLLRARDALAAEPRTDRLAPALERALALGATSGADTLRGLLHAASACLDSVRTAR